MFCNLLRFHVSTLPWYDLRYLCRYFSGPEKIWSREIFCTLEMPAQMHAITPEKCANIELQQATEHANPLCWSK